jgi:outer membrane protein assembly factor BamE
MLQPAFPPRAALATAALLAATLLAGCGTFDNASQRISGIVTPYKVEVVQGNFVSREQVEALKAGMSRQQVRDILGTPLVTSLFHADRWDYVFTLRRQGVEPQQRKLAVFFNGDAMARVEGDPMPSESEFVATLDKRKSAGKVPPLQASEEALKAFDARRVAPRPDAAAPAPSVPAATSYPPLEPPAR